MSITAQSNGLMHGDFRILELMTGKSYEIVKKVAHGRKDDAVVQAAIVELIESRKLLINDFRTRYKTVKETY